MKSSAYTAAGVNLDAADDTINLITDAVRSTYDARVLAGIGAFGGLFELTDLPERPVLVASTDGVGTKTVVAASTNQYEGLGFDIVNHCINDILVQGAKPLFFLDYIASSRLDPQVVARVVVSAAEACRAAGVALLGGETAEMPGVYQRGELDLVGTIIGVVDRSRIIDGSSIRSGDVVVALESGGLQTNGFSLARAILSERYQQPLGTGTIADALLVPHRSYLNAVMPLLDADLVHGLAHITGGGIPGNLGRILPEGLGAELQTGSWPVPEIFALLSEAGQVTMAEMHRVFNMGAGFMLVLPRENLERARELAGEPLHEIGVISAGSGVTLL